jgi:hypothetical protein
MCIDVSSFLTSTITSLSSLNMAKKSDKKANKKDDKKEEKNTKWSDADDAVLVQTLTNEKANSIWADNNPKKTSWTVCELALKGSELLSGRAPKNVTTIRN